MNSWNGTPGTPFPIRLSIRGILHWFSEAGDAVLGYVERWGVRIVAGAPVCSEERLCAVLEGWNQDTRRAGKRSCYFGAAGRLYHALADDPAYSVITLGAQPAWNPQEWPAETALRASLRAQLARARNKGVRVTEWDWRRAQGNPELTRVLGEWLFRKPLPSLHFLIEPETLHSLRDKRIFVAERNGAPVGFVNAAPVPAQNGWLTEQFIRGGDAPNGTVELLLDATFRAVGQSGATYLTMGLVPLATPRLGTHARQPILAPSDACLGASARATVL